MDAYALAPDLWRWTGRHDGIGREVGCIYYKTGRDILLFDPLLPPEDPEGFWRALDRDVLPIDADVHVLVTRPSHTRSSRELVARYPRARLWAGRDVAAEVEERAGTVTDPFVPGDSLPAGVDALSSGREGEVVFWIPEHGALVVGDVLVSGEDGLSLSPRLGDAAGQVREALSALRDRDVRLVLPSHGEPAAGDELERLL